MTKVTHIDDHKWKFEDEHVASTLFDILMCSELGDNTNYNVFQEFDVRITGSVGNIYREIKVKKIAIDHDHKEIIILSEDDDFYGVNLNKSVAQFVKKYWEPD